VSTNISSKYPKYPNGFSVFSVEGFVVVGKEWEPTGSNVAVDVLSLTGKYKNLFNTLSRLSLATPVVVFFPVAKFLYTALFE